MSNLIYQQLPKIEAAKISFIKVFIMPDFITSSNTLKAEYAFLSSPSDYMRYYTDYEKSLQETNKKFALSKIPELGSLKPLKKRHTMNSFWKAFRLRYEKEKTSITSQDLFFFLPLRIKIPIGNLSVDKREFPAKMFVYIFPFGSCTVNIEIDIENNSFFFDEFIDLIEKLRLSATIKDKNCNFEDFAKSIAKKINDTIFTQGTPTISSSSHSIILIKKTSKRLTLDPTMKNLKDQISGIAALLAGKKDAVNQTDEHVNKILSCKMKEIHEEEILLFQPNRTILYPSNSWIEQIQLAKKEQIGEFYEDSSKIDQMIGWHIDRSLDCMYDNYRSLLNVIFAWSRLLQDYLLLHKAQIPDEKRQKLAESFFKIFPKSDAINDNTFYYYLHASDKIASRIGIYDKIEEFKSQ